MVRAAIATVEEPRESSGRLVDGLEWEPEQRELLGRKVEGGLLVALTEQALGVEDALL